MEHQPIVLIEELGDLMHGWLVCVLMVCVESLAWINLPQARFVCSFVFLLFCCWMGRWVGELLKSWVIGCTVGMVCVLMVCGASGVA